MGHRSYDQYCPVAVALDVVGDRWTLLIMRELLMGERRFTDLRIALPGLAPNLLADRLRDLQAEGIVEQRELPAPAARTVYAATGQGRALVPVLQALARFGAERLGPPDDADPQPRVAVYGMLTPFHRPEPAGARFHARLEIDGSTFDVVTDGDRLSTRPRPGDTPDVVVETTARDVVAARQGRRPLATAGADDPALDRFARLFQLA
ncbi:MAG: helix-turn-helix domain-containing protein [Ilumatobacteraceae bacterium]